jgi:hypothetical protein
VQLLLPPHLLFASQALNFSCISLLYSFSALLMSISLNFAQSHLDAACPSSPLLCVMAGLPAWWTH